MASPVTIVLLALAPPAYARNKSGCLQNWSPCFAGPTTYSISTSGPITKHGKESTPNGTLTTLNWCLLERITYASSRRDRYHIQADPNSAFPDASL